MNSIVISSGVSTASRVSLDEMKRSPYSVLYRDNANCQRVFCCYAGSAYEARIEAMEMVQFIHDHPNCIDQILKEATDFDW